MVAASWKVSDRQPGESRVGVRPET